MTIRPDFSWGPSLAHQFHKFIDTLCVWGSALSGKSLNGGKALLNLDRKQVQHVLALLFPLMICSPAFAQGIHTNLRSNINPSPGNNVYSDVVAEGNYAYVASWHNTSG